MNEPSQLKHSPLEGSHIACGARMVEFGGWFMPVQYTGIMDEHRAVRSAAGMFDISHMGEVIVSGSGALAWLESLLTNRVGKLAPGRGQYTLMLDEQGGSSTISSSTAPGMNHTSLSSMPPAVISISSGCVLICQKGLM